MDNLQHEPLLDPEYDPSSHMRMAALVLVVAGIICAVLIAVALAWPVL